MWMLEPGSRKTASPSPNRFAVGWKRFAVAMEEGRGPKRGPCANMGCKNPDTSGGQWNWLPPPTELAGFDLREDAVCRCNKRACARSTSGERRGGSSRRPCSRAARMTRACRSSIRSRRSRRYGASGALAPFLNQSRPPCPLPTLAPCARQVHQPQ